MLRFSPITMFSPLAVPISRAAPAVCASSGCSETEEAQRSGQATSPFDSLELSPEAEEAQKSQGAQQARESQETPESQASLADGQQLDEAEQEQVQELKARDREVRSHEAAHAAAAGPYASGGPTYEYQKGPDGHRYAVGGELQIDVSPVDGDPAATIRKMQVVRAAALAPADPSSQDRAVAAAATRQEAQAAGELAQSPPADSESSRSPSAVNGSAPFSSEAPASPAATEPTPGAAIGHVLDVIA